MALAANVLNAIGGTPSTGPVAGGPSPVPELHVVCVSGDDWRRSETPDLICPVRNYRSGGLSAIVAIGKKKDGTPFVCVLLDWEIILGIKVGIGANTIHPNPESPFDRDTAQSLAKSTVIRAATIYRFWAHD